MFSLTNKNIFENFQTLNAATYNVEIYLDKKSGPGILSIDIYVNGIKKSSENFVCQNSTCYKKSISFNEKSIIKVQIKSKYAGVTIVKRTNFVDSESKKILKSIKGRIYYKSQ